MRLTLAAWERMTARSAQGNRLEVFLILVSAATVYFHPNTQNCLRSPSGTFHPRK